MASTLAHGAAGRRRVRWRVAADAALVAAVLGVLVARGGDGDPLLPDRVRSLGPAEAGRYRMVGTERDGRTGRTARTAEAFTVDPWFEVDGVDHQVTRAGAGAGTVAVLRPVHVRPTARGAANVSSGGSHRCDTPPAEWRRR